MYKLTDAGKVGSSYEKGTCLKYTDTDLALTLKIVDKILLWEGGGDKG
jgi:hypothetical protein